MSSSSSSSATIVPDPGTAAAVPLSCPVCVNPATAAQNTQNLANTIAVASTVSANLQKPTYGVVSSNSEKEYFLNSSANPRKEWVCIKQDEACVRVLKPTLSTFSHYATSTDCTSACFKN